MTSSWEAMPRREARLRGGRPWDLVEAVTAAQDRSPDTDPAHRLGRLLDGGAAAADPAGASPAAPWLDALEALSIATAALGTGSPLSPSEICETLGRLAQVAEALPQILEQLTVSVQRQHADEDVAVEPDSEFAGDPGLAVSTATTSMHAGQQLAAQLAAALRRGSQALDHAYSGDPRNAAPGHAAPGQQP